MNQLGDGGKDTTTPLLQKMAKASGSGRWGRVGFGFYHYLLGKGLLGGKGIEDESPPLHSLRKRMVMDQVAKASSPSPHWEKWKSVKGESPPLHPIEKKKSMVLDQIAWP